jgi:hypothetical protein
MPQNLFLFFFCGQDFDKMYAAWELKFEDWKKINKDNPDR